MKIGGRSGHNPLATGAVGIVDEVLEDTKIFNASKKYLQSKYEFVNCYPGNMNGVSQELMYGISKANSNGVGLFYSVHLNKAYDSYNGAIGSEIWLHPNCSQDTKNKANRILNNFTTLGFKNRGIKYSNQLAELNSTNMEAMIIECFFCEATEDVNIYNKVGADALGFAIANGIDSSITIEKPKPQRQYRNVVVYAKGKEADKYIASILSWYLEDCICLDHTKYVEGIGRSVYSVGALTGIKADVVFRGKDRKETLDLVLKRIGKLA
ncbi:N-acetylmuramoyl-L-alanine amidase [Clostridium senegalense]